ncbi:RHS repeat-associated core domain-containing protein [Chitinivorax sp. B]|uniref:RHS repeat-associated core domain-containing protein n=1 Tax=Chitinivorax sp. B TaxID=2502235 RepID=UPI0010F869A4|nr:RHS repeat-associated core domain-containing protein [Chitinivorax sp. B]
MQLVREGIAHDVSGGKGLGRGGDGGLNREWYTGKTHDDDTGLDYFGARYYDAVAGRFLAMDPVDVNPASLYSFNRYGYANNNPYRYNDPTGMESEGASGGLGDKGTMAMRGIDGKVHIQQKVPGFQNAPMGNEQVASALVMGVGAPEIAGTKAMAAIGVVFFKGESIAVTATKLTRVKRGPKTDPAAPHNAKIKEIGDRIINEGGRIIAGGGSKAEKSIPTPGGFKQHRRPDVIYEDAQGLTRGINVGRTNAAGAPVTREQKALSDLNNQVGLPTTFERYD